MGMYEDVLRFWMEQYNSGMRSVSGSTSPATQVIVVLRQYGPAHPYLYPLVLCFLTSIPELLSAHQADLEEILEHVEHKHIMAPLTVVQVLSRNGVASVGLVKGWLMWRIAEGREEIATMSSEFIAIFEAHTKV